jgi:hypothetical protein
MAVKKASVRTFETSVGVLQEVRAKVNAILDGWTALPRGRARGRVVPK